MGGGGGGGLWGIFVWLFFVVSYLLVIEQSCFSTMSVFISNCQSSYKLNML